jgi:hypothetical protein
VARADVSGFSIKVDGVELGTVSNVSFSDAPEPPVLESPLPRSINFSAPIRLEPHSLARLMRFFERERRRRWRAARPMRKAQRRALSRKRIEATRRWHQNAELRAAYTDLLAEFGIKIGDQHYSADPYKGVRR